MGLVRSLRSRRWKLEGRLARTLSPWLARRLGAAVELDCPTERHGEGSAGYVICPEGLGPESVVYSCGVGNDISFDRSLIARFGLSIDAFDPTGQSAAYLASQPLPPGYRFCQQAVAAIDGQLTFAAMRPSRSQHYLAGTVLKFDRPAAERQTVEARRLGTLMKERGHTRIDLLKLDIEGAEYAVLDDMLSCRLDVRQIVLEFHPHLANIEHHAWMIGRTGWKRTQGALEALRESGYRVFFVSQRGTDLSFLRDAA
jgi:FkbM family methyltransferase